MLLREIALRERDPGLLGGVRARGRRPGQGPGRDRAAARLRPPPRRPADAGQGVQRLRPGNGSWVVIARVGRSSARLVTGSGRQVKATRASAVVYRCTLVRRDGSWRVLHFAPSTRQSRYSLVALVARMRRAVSRAAASSRPPASTSARRTLARARRQTIAPTSGTRGRRARPTRPAACPAGTGRAPPTPSGSRSARPGRSPATGPCAPAGRCRPGGRRRRHRGSSRAAPPGSPRCGGRAAAARAGPGRRGAGTRPRRRCRCRTGAAPGGSRPASAARRTRNGSSTGSSNRAAEAALSRLVNARRRSAWVDSVNSHNPPRWAAIDLSATTPRSMAVPTRSSNPPRNRASDLAVGAPGRAAPRPWTPAGRSRPPAGGRPFQLGHLTTWSLPAPVSTSSVAVPAWSSSSRR